MSKKTIVKKNEYYDSVTLMVLGHKISDMEGIQEAVVIMGTEMNRAILKNVGLDTPESDSATSNDLIFALLGDSDEIIEEALTAIEAGLKPVFQDNQEKKEQVYTSISMAKEAGANFAIISAPGTYAYREADRALESGMDVMLFSDNISLKEEKALKLKAKEKKLLMMGPDCGTAMVDGVGLCFSNQVRKGTIGLVGASGTGSQEFMVQVHRMGGGISQLYGTGGRDLKESIGGIMMLECLERLANDEDTEVIAIISKPADSVVKERILARVQTIRKPTVICFIDDEGVSDEEKKLYFVKTIRDAAKQCVLLSGVELEQENMNSVELNEIVFTPEQTTLRGLFCGGTLCAESLSLLRKAEIFTRSNIGHGAEALSDEEALNSGTLTGNILLDLGDDMFTNGRPHPMIDPTMRRSYILECIKQKEVRVIMLDFELGWGSSKDPVGDTIEAIEAVKAQSNIAIVAYICGTNLDYQILDSQEARLKQAGVFVAQSNEEMVQMAIRLMK